MGPVGLFTALFHQSSLALTVSVQGVEAELWPGSPQGGVCLFRAALLLGH